MTNQINTDEFLKKSKEFLALCPVCKKNPRHTDLICDLCAERFERERGERLTAEYKERFSHHHQDDDGISERDRRADYLYESGYGNKVGLDSFAYDSHGNDTGLRESDFI